MQTDRAKTGKEKLDYLFGSLIYEVKRLLQRTKVFDIMSNKLVWIIICFGILLRLVQYLFNRSLWLDESFIALNIINKSFSELFLPLDYNQAAPIGFLMIEKLAVQVFGNSEYTLRLFPFISGIISLFLFYEIAKYYIKPNAVPIALGLFAILSSLIYYSSEVKPYSSDVAIALLLYYVTIYIQPKRLTIPNITIFGIIGVIAIWFSYTSLFILAGVGVSLTLSTLKRRDWSRIGQLSIVFLLWMLSFATYYFVSLNFQSDNEVLLNFWSKSNSFMPFPPSLSDSNWFVQKFFEIFQYPLGLSSIAVFAFLVGCVSIFLENKERFLLIISPILFALLASGFYMYPFKGRLLLFIVPSLLLFIAEGTEQIRNNNNNKHLGAIIGIIFIGLLFYGPLISASHDLIKPITVEEIKPVINYVKEHKQDGDLLYLYYGSQYAFKYYSENYGFNETDYIIGVKSRNDRVNYINDLDKLRGNKRVWILFSHVSGDEDSFFQSYLDSIGIRVDSFMSDGAAVYLYDLEGGTNK